MGRPIHLPFRQLHPRALALRWILVIPLAIQTGAMALLMGWLSWQSGQRAVEILAMRLQRETASRVSDYLEPRLALTQELARFVAQAIRRGQLDIADPEARQRFFWHTLTGFESVDNLAWGDRTGEYLALQFDVSRSRMELLQAEPRSQGRSLVTYRLDRSGQYRATEPVRETPNFDPRDRPWYRSAAAAQRAVWSPIFPFFNDGSTLVLAANYPVYGRFGDLEGVVSTRIYLADLNAFLQQLQISSHGLAFVVDEEDLLVASSQPTPLMTGMADASAQKAGSPPQRLRATEGRHDTLRAIAQALAQTPHGAVPPTPTPASPSVPGDRALTLELHGQRHLVREMPFRDDYGLRWRIIIAIPETDFAEQLVTNKRTILLSLAVALVGSVVLSFLTARWLERPIRRLVDAADRLAQGSWQISLPHSRIGELDRLAIAFQTTADHLQHTFDELERQAITDPLTGLLNRAGFSRQLDHILSDQGQALRPFALLFLDLDDFKVVNDTLGHPTGDRLLMAVAQRLQQTLPPEATLSRFGGDEFIILLPVTSPQEATAIAVTICNGLNRPFTLQGHTIFARTSIGLFHSDASTARQAGDALRDADLALYAAKRQGKSRYVPFDDTMRQRSRNRFELESDLHQAIDRGELETFYQPIISLRTGQITSFEALLRWRHPIRGLISPTVFIPIAEETGAIVELGEWILDQACQQTQRWCSDPTLLTSPRIAVNCSIVQLGHGNFADHVLNIVRRSQLDLNHLTLEITESLLMQGADQAQTHLETLSAQGIQLSIDDFGTGYSSLSYLHRLPLNSLKIDRSFISDLGSNPRNLSIVRAIITLAHQLDLGVVAEGVSSPHHVRQLRSMHCNSAQGFLLSPPVPAIAATDLLRRPSLLS
jgi:diguanylate cyclase (GGDEF)-like protein